MLLIFVKLELLVWSNFELLSVMNSGSSPKSIFTLIWPFCTFNQILGVFVLQNKIRD